MGAVKRRFAEIESRIRRLFEADEPPTFAPSVHVVEVTDVDGLVYERQRFDIASGRPIVDPTSIPSGCCPIEDAAKLYAEPKVVLDNGQPALEEMGYVGNVWLRKHFYPKKGDSFGGHRHHHDHMTLVAQGSVMVQVEGQEEAKIFHAPTFLKIDKNLRHKTTAMEDKTILWCIFALRDAEGNVTDLYNGVNTPYTGKL